MNNLRILQGGHHFTGDDLLFVQEQLTNAIKAICETTGESFIAISGVEIAHAGPNITWTAGLIYHAGEVFEVQAGAAPYPANNTFEIFETYDPAGDIVYEDLVAEQTYQYRRLSISGNAGGAREYSNLKHFKDSFCAPKVGWASLAGLMSGSWGAVNGGMSVAGYRSSISKEFHLNGEVSINNFNLVADSEICTLPVPPAKKLTFLCPAIKNTLRDFIHVEVDIDGTMRPLGLVNTDDCVIFLESIRYPLDWSGII